EKMITDPDGTETFGIGGEPKVKFKRAKIEYRDYESKTKASCEYRFV
ncbi:MAG: hypothetical protein GY866_34815, partial [Proteobacteria bacterium]|nr:hypothetical protein [Pseudomonadota bacterium]